MISNPAPAESAALTDSRLSALCAETTQSAFVEYDEQFHTITLRAKERFLARDWRGSFADAAERLHLYTREMEELTQQIRDVMGSRLYERSIWMGMKAVYSSLIAHSPKRELAESFFNSLTRRVFATEGVDQAIEFVDTDFDEPPIVSQRQPPRSYSEPSIAQLLSAALTDSVASFSKEHWCALGEAVQAAAKRIGAAVDGRRDATLEIVGNVFYRGRGAYLVARVSREDSGAAVPIAFCLRHESDQGIELDAVLIGETDLAILFSFTRSYFRVDTACPYTLVRSLGELMPRKRLIDLYNAIGFHRHGKTEFYRDFVRHLRTSSDRFVPAEGTRGMVMLVFTLPSYDVVFKLIKDHFDYPKESTREEVMRRYRLVFEHDRAGRLVEAHEFEHLRIARERFDPGLLEDLLRDAGSTVRLEGDDVVIAHAYVERRIRPLNLFLLEADESAVADAARDYGQSIKDLAASNIFPGDLLTKNFGVTRTGRVVFYDYDELCFITDCNFRDMPQPTTPEQETAAEPWYSVRENDIFPEEFPNFLSLPGAARPALFEQHADLFRAAYWRDVQQKLRAGEIPQVLPYLPERRLQRPSD
ncbi:MAG TPA: bifunctional isocitrate dehydrogenase kinase/phosphatase [Chthoniobacterales bacterium]|nr:bifunctional isocitrate dehydrogenase kinase/phosphatase [Chthoniobacterales bacterium]